MGQAIYNFDEREYTNEFIKNHYTEKYHSNHWDIFRYRNLNAARIIHENINFNSVVDFGCSIGTYLEYFKNKGCEVRGYEYCFDECVPHISKIDGLIECISFGDISKPIVTEKTYDLSMSIEVAEHIPSSRSEILVDNLCNSSGKWIFFTAAGIDQGGTGHINCQEKEFWIQKFTARGWKRNESVENKIKSTMIPVYENDGRNDYPFVWIFVYDNLMVFEK